MPREARSPALERFCVSAPLCNIRFSVSLHNLRAHALSAAWRSRPSEQRPRSPSAYAALVAPPHQGGRQEEVGRRAITRNRDVVDNGNAQQRLDIDVVWMGLQRIPEEDDEIDSPLDDARANLLVAPQRPAQEAGHREAQVARDQGSCRPGGAEVMMRERAPVIARPVEQIELAIVMSNECDPLPLRHRNAQIS